VLFVSGSTIDNGASSFVAARAWQGKGGWKPVLTDLDVRGSIKATMPWRLRDEDETRWRVWAFFPSLSLKCLIDVREEATEYGGRWELAGLVAQGRHSVKVGLKLPAAIGSRGKGGKRGLDPFPLKSWPPEGRVQYYGGLGFVVVQIGKLASEPFIFTPFFLGGGEPLDRHLIDSVNYSNYLDDLGFQTIRHWKYNPPFLVFSFLLLKTIPEGNLLSIKPLFHSPNITPFPQTPFSFLFIE
jgi:hypothetical protein